MLVANYFYIGFDDAGLRVEKFKRVGGGGGCERNSGNGKVGMMP